MQRNNETQQLKQALQAADRSIAWAARQVECSYGHFHDVLNGRRNLSVDMREKIREKIMPKLAPPIAG